MTNKYNWLAGLFLLGGIAGTVAMSFFFAGGTPLGWNRRFTVRFSLADGTGGLKSGSYVTLGGQVVGQVVGISFEYAPDAAGLPTRRPTAVLVAVQIREDLELLDNARISLDKPLLGTISGLNITDTGDPLAYEGHAPLAFIGSGPVLQSDETIPGGLAPPAILASAGIGPKQIDDLKSALEDIKITMAKARDLMGTNSDRLQSTIDRVSRSVDMFADSLPEWSKSLERILATINAGADRLDPILTKVDVGVDKAVKIVDSTQELLDRNTARIDSIFKNIDLLASGLAGDTLGYVLEALRETPAITRSAKAATEDAAKIMSQLRAEMPSVRRTIASTRQATESLKIGIDEIVAQPWRVLQRPSTRELREQLVYDSARAYATAVGDMRSFAEALDALASQGKQADAEALRAAVSDLKDSATKAKAAESELERQMLELLVANRSGKDQPRGVSPKPADIK